MGKKNDFTPLEKATDFNRRSLPIEGGGGLKPPSPRTVKKQSSLTGFTLIEATIVAVLFSVVGITLLATFSSGIKIWRKVYSKDSEEGIFIFLDTVSSDLRNTIKYSSVSFSGTKTSMSFVTYVVTRSRLSGLGEGIGEVNYYWDKDRHSIFRTVRNLSDVYKNTAGSIRDVLDGVDNFELSYHFYDTKEKKSFWLSKWDKKKIPISVRIRLSVSYDKRTVSYLHTVDIPQGQVMY